MFVTYNTHCFELIFIFFDEKKPVDVPPKTQEWTCTKIISHAD